MNKKIIPITAAMAAIFISLPVSAQESQKPASESISSESEPDIEAMMNRAELLRARTEWRKEHMKAKAPDIKPELVKNDALKQEDSKSDSPKADEQMKETAPSTVTLRPTTVTTTPSISAEQMRRIVERDRARLDWMEERARAGYAEAQAEKYLEEHPVDFTPGKTPADWTDNLTAAIGKAKAEKKPILALFTGSDWCPPCQKLEKNILLQPAFKEFAKKHLVLLFLDFPHDAKLDDGVKQQNESLAKKFSVGAYPTILILSADGQKELWKHLGYDALFLEKLRDGIGGLDKDFPDTAKAVKAEMETEKIDK